AKQAQLLDRKPTGEVVFAVVGEEDEKQQLILPEWLAPESADLPWGFQPFTKNGEPWPSSEVLSAHERLVVVPFKGEYLLYALPPLE
ncbi:MAG: hypothetical protein NZ869_10350, partial [Thermoanaerobaculum sp.]|nr:hypothetical protein [Thermoanaerobaculum sp.]MDW7966500.1 hypothetical protein [Thermoanaerobaculum sp.]